MSDKVESKSSRQVLPCPDSNITENLNNEIKDRGATPVKR